MTSFLEKELKNSLLAEFQGTSLNSCSTSIFLLQRKGFSGTGGFWRLTAILRMKSFECESVPVSISPTSASNLLNLFRISFLETFSKFEKLTVNEVFSAFYFEDISFRNWQWSLSWSCFLGLMQVKLYWIQSFRLIIICKSVELQKIEMQ